MLMAIGVVLIILGTLMLVAPVLAGIMSILVIGAIMVAAGVVICARGFKGISLMSRVTWLLVGIVTLVCGLFVIAHPLFGLGFMTILLAVYFFTDGIVKLAAAFRYSYGRGWLITSGLLSLLLAYFIWVSWPLSGQWAVGVLVGVNFIFTGIVTLAVKDAIT